MQTRRAFLGGSLALPAQTVAARAQRDAAILRYGLSAYPPNLLPWENTGSASGAVKLLTHRSLVAYDHLGQLRGEIAQSWSLGGDGAWVFKLRSDALFHNGEPVAQRIAIYREMQLAALEETPLVGLTWRAQDYAMDRSAQGFTNLPGELTTSSGGMIEETYFG